MPYVYLLKGAAIDLVQQEFDSSIPELYLINNIYLEYRVSRRNHTKQVTFLL